jgi:hypothetical protein
LLFKPAMRGTAPNTAILLALTALLVTGLASTADAKVGGNAAAAAAQKMSKGTQVRLNRMKAKMALRPRGTMAQKTRRQIRLGKRKMVKLMGRRQLRGSKVQLMRAASRREIGLGGGESEQARQRSAIDLDGSRYGAPDIEAAPAKNKGKSQSEEELEKLGLKQRKKMRVTARRHAAKAFKKLRDKRRD